MHAGSGPTGEEREIHIPSAGVELAANLVMPEHAAGIVLFAHGSGSSRHSPRNRRVARQLQQAGFATLLMDLLTEDEEQVDLHTRQHRFDIPLLAERLAGATGWVGRYHATQALPVGYFGASTGGAAALVAATELPARVAAVVSRGGRPDLAGEALGRVRAPTLLIVGGLDTVVIDLNKEAMTKMTHAEVRLEIVPGASHLFEEPGALDEVARLAIDWFRAHLAAPPDRRGAA